MRITNTRTGKTTAAKDGADLALMVKVELDRRTGIELAGPPTRQTPAERAGDMHEANRIQREAIA